MDDFSVPAGPFGYVDSTQEVEWNSIHAQKIITEFALLCKNPPLYEVKKKNQKRLCPWRNFKITLLGRKYYSQVHIPF